jgi:hypothetical protein
LIVLGFWGFGSNRQCFFGVLGSFRVVPNWMAWVISASAIVITTEINGQDSASTNGSKKLGAHKVPPIVTRGVMLDMAAYFGVEIVKEGTAYNQAEIGRACQNGKASKFVRATS